jgi:hypothetical protein
MAAINLNKKATFRVETRIWGDHRESWRSYATRETKTGLGAAAGCKIRFGH